MMRRMANFVVAQPAVFPEGTVVKAYLRSAWHQSQGGAPTGPKVAEATISSGTATLEGLTEGRHYVLYAEVGGKDAYLEVSPETLAAGVLTQPSIARPSTHGLLGWSFDPDLASGTKILETAGTLHGAKIFIPEPCKITNLHMWMTVKAATLTALENGLGLFAEGTRTLLGKIEIAKLIEAWEGATGEVKLALEAPVNVPAGFIYGAGYYKGTTAPTFSTAAPTIGVLNANVATTKSRFFTADTGLTTALPATMTASMVASSQPFWMAVS